MNKASIAIDVKKKSKKRKRATIDVAYDTDLAILKMQDIGDAITSVNQSAEVTIEYAVFNNISRTWMTMASYYANEKRIVKH